LSNFEVTCELSYKTDHFLVRRLSIKGRCYKRENGYKTHRAKRPGFKLTTKIDDNLEGIRKRKQDGNMAINFFI